MQLHMKIIHKVAKKATEGWKGGIFLVTFSLALLLVISGNLLLGGLVLIN